MHELYSVSQGWTSMLGVAEGVVGVAGGVVAAGGQ